jgi:hypothetical protein
MSKRSSSQQSGRLTQGAASVKGGTVGEGGSRSTMRRLPTNGLEQSLERNTDGSKAPLEPRSRSSRQKLFFAQGFALGLFLGVGKLFRKRPLSQSSVSTNDRDRLKGFWARSHRPRFRVATALTALRGHQYRVALVVLLLPPGWSVEDACHYGTTPKDSP